MDSNEIKSVAESIRVKISEANKDKKNEWELKANGVSKKEKAEAQAEIKQQADKAKEEQKIADGYDKIATGAGSNHDKFNHFNDKYQDHLLKAQSHNIDKQKLAGEIRTKLGKTRGASVSEAVPALAGAIARGVQAIARNPHVQKGLVAFGDAYASKVGNGVGDHLADKTIEVVKKKAPLSEACACFMNCMEVSQEAAQKVVNRKVDQLARDGEAMVRHTNNAHHITDIKGERARKCMDNSTNLNRGALRIANAGKKAGAYTKELNQVGSAHNRANVDVHLRNDYKVKEMSPKSKALGNNPEKVDKARKALVDTRKAEDMRKVFRDFTDKSKIK